MRKFLGMALFFTMIASAQSETSGSFATDVTRKVEVGYVLKTPKDIRSAKPMIVFLHGSGEKGTDTKKLSVNGPLKYAKNNPLDAYILAPQCRENEFWDEESVYRLIEKILESHNIDRNRVYLTGLSLGGWGALKLGMAHPEMFAALVPICGFFDRNDRGRICNIREIPTRLYHGLLDDIVSPEYAAELYKRLKDCNANATLTIFEDANHNSWDRVYDSSEIYDWMLRQSKK